MMSAMPFLITLATLQGKRQNPQTYLNSAYAVLNSAYKKNDYKQVAAWMTTHTTNDFAYTSLQKATYKRDTFLAGVKDQVKAIQSVSKQAIRVGKVSVSGKSLTVVTSGDFEGVVLFDGKQLLMTDASESIDTWVLDGTTWKLKSVKVTKEDVQMRERK